MKNLEQFSFETKLRTFCNEHNTSLKIIVKHSKEYDCGNYVIVGKPDDCMDVMKYATTFNADFIDCYPSADRIRNIVYVVKTFRRECD